MNLLQIWKRHKTLAILLFVYFLLFIGLNVKQGIVATPVLQYGMFSGMQKLEDTAIAYVFYANDKNIPLSNFTFTERDILLTSLNNYLGQKENNEGVYNSFGTIMQKIKSNLKNNKEKFTNRISDSTFKNWYKLKLEKITNQKIENIEIYKQKIYWKDYKINTTDTLQKIFTIVN